MPSRGQYTLLNIVDGGSLTDLAKKGNLRYVETLYNPGKFFRAVYHVVFSKGELSVPLQDETIQLHALNRTRHIPKIDFFLNLLYYIYQTTSMVRRYRINLIRSRGAYVAGILSVLAGKINGVPVVVSLGGDNRLAQRLEGKYYFNSRFLSYNLEAFVLRHADMVFCPNEFTRNYVGTLGVKESKTAVVPLLLPDQLFHAVGDGAKIRKELDWPREPIVLSISRLTPYKQVDVLVDAIPLVLTQVPSAKFLFVGDGISKSTLIEKCVTLGIMDSVKFVGSQPSQKVPDYLSASDVVWVSMSGFVVYEAAAAEKPIVAFDVEWHQEFIENCKTGILVRNRDRRELAKTVTYLLENPSHAKKLGRNAKLKMQRQYDPARLIDLETHIYEQIIQTNRTPSRSSKPTGS